MTENRAHQTSTQFPIMYKSIKMSPFKITAESHIDLSAENAKVIENDDFTPLLNSNNDYIQRGRKYEIFARQQYFKLQGWRMINQRQNIEAPK